MVNETWCGTYHRIYELHVLGFPQNVTQSAFFNYTPSWKKRGFTVFALSVRTYEPIPGLGLAFMIRVSCFVGLKDYH